MRGPDTMNGMNRRRLLGVLASAAAAAGPLLASCGALVPPPPQLYTLTPKTTFPADLRKVDWQLLVEMPTAGAGLDTSRVAVLRDRTAQDYFANVAWTDRVTAMVQRLTLESFEASDKIVSVGRESMGLRADFTLKLDIRAFQAEYTRDGLSSPDQASVRFTAKLVSMRRRVIEDGEGFEGVAPIQGDGFGAVVAAFDEALGKALKGLVVWTLRAGDAAERRGRLG